jgi:hypothetical protein
MRDPEVKLGLHRMLTVLRGLAVYDEEITREENEQ